MNKPHRDDSEAGLSGVLGVIEKLAKLADDLQNATGEISRKGEVDLGKNTKASYHFRVRTLGDLKRNAQHSDFKPFSKSASPKPKLTDAPRITLAEPETDVFIEGNVVVIYAQLPGVSESDVLIDLHVDCLTFRAKSATMRYEKTITLPASVQPETLVKSYKNGILEVRLTRTDKLHTEHTA
jgi:HSP20 family protein